MPTNEVPTETEQENTPDEIEKANVSKGNEDSAPPQLELATATPLANLMQGDEGNNGSTVSVRAQMAAESVLLACRQDAVRL